jgi:phage major head subunit gpT-like protein
MAVINTGLLTKGIRNDFYKTFDGVQTFFADLTTRIASDGDSETYKFLGQVPQVREWGTGRIAKGLRAESYSVANLKYEATLEVDRDEVSDAQLNQIKPRISELATRAATHKDFLVSQLLINGQTAGFESYDGVTFFNDAHSYGDSGSNDNKLTYDATLPDVPTIAECRIAFGQVLNALMNFKDDQGEPYGHGATGLVVVCHPTVMLTWMETMTSALISNSDNILKQFNVRVLAMPWLTDVSQWYLLKTDLSVRPFIFQDREPIEFGSLEGKSEQGFLREVYLYGIRARYRVTYGAWYAAVSCDFT